MQYNWTNGYPCLSSPRDVLGLPGCQQDLIQALNAAAPSTPLIVVLNNGGAISSVAFRKYSSAILDAFYPGQSGGQAVAEVVFGLYNPGLSSTFCSIDFNCLV